MTLLVQLILNKNKKKKIPNHNKINSSNINNNSINDFQKNNKDLIMFVIKNKIFIRVFFTNY